MKGGSRVDAAGGRSKSTRACRCTSVPESEGGLQKSMNEPSAKARAFSRPFCEGKKRARSRARERERERERRANVPRFEKRVPLDVLFPVSPMHAHDRSWSEKIHRNVLEPRSTPSCATLVCLQLQLEGECVATFAKEGSSASSREKKTSRLTHRRFPEIRRNSHDAVLPVRPRPPPSLRNSTQFRWQLFRWNSQRRPRAVSRAFKARERFFQRTERDIYIYIYIYPPRGIISVRKKHHPIRTLRHSRSFSFEKSRRRRSLEKGVSRNRVSEGYEAGVSFAAPRSMTDRHGRDLRAAAEALRGPRDLFEVVQVPCPRHEVIDLRFVLSARLYGTFQVWPSGTIESSHVSRARVSVGVLSRTHSLVQIASETVSNHSQTPTEF